MTWRRGVRNDNDSITIITSDQKFKLQQLRLTCEHVIYTGGQRRRGSERLQLLDLAKGDQRLRGVSRSVADVFLTQITESPVVRGQFDVFGAGLRMQALTQWQLTVRHQTDRGTRRVDGERANVRVELGKVRQDKTSKSIRMGDIGEQVELWTVIQMLQNINNR